MNASWHETVNLSRTGINRRRFLHTVSAAGLAAGTLSFRDLVSLQAEELRKQKKAVIVLWMAGAPSQMGNVRSEAEP